VTPFRQRGKPYIETAADFDQWLEAFRAVAQAELEKGNRISLIKINLIK
jgi:hypothetical protein